MIDEPKSHLYLLSYDPFVQCLFCTDNYAERAFLF